MMEAYQSTAERGIQDISNTTYTHPLNFMPPKTPDRTSKKKKGILTFCTPSRSSYHQETSSSTANERMMTDTAVSSTSNLQRASSSSEFSSSSSNAAGAPIQHLEVVFHETQPKSAVVVKSTPSKKKKDKIIKKLNSADKEQVDPSVVVNNNNKAMSSPGMAIPTPYVKRSTLNSTTAAADDPSPSQHYHSRRQPSIQLEQHLTLSESVISEGAASSIATTKFQQEDESAFLPNEASTIFTMQQVQTMIQEAQLKLSKELQQRHEQELQEFEADVEKSLMEHGQQWKQDAEVEYKRLGDLLRAEQSKTVQTTQQMMEQQTEMESLQQKLKEMEQDRCQFKSRTIDLEQQVSGGDMGIVLKRHAKELEEMASQKEEAERKLQLLEQTVSGMQRRQMQSQRSEDESSSVPEGHEEELRLMQEAKDHATNELRQELAQLRSLKEEAEKQLDLVQSQLLEARKGKEREQVQLRNSQREMDELRAQMLNNSLASEVSSTSTQVIELQQEIASLRKLNEQLMSPPKGTKTPTKQIATAVESRSSDTNFAKNESTQSLREQLKTVTNQRDAYEKYVKVLREQQRKQGDSEGSEVFVQDVDKMTKEFQSFHKEEIEKQKEQAASDTQQALHKQREQLQQEFEKEKSVLVQKVIQLDSIHQRQIELLCTEDSEASVNELQQQLAILFVNESYGDMVDVTTFSSKINLLKAHHQTELQESQALLEEESAKVKALQGDLDNVCAERDELQIKLAKTEGKVAETEKKHLEEVEEILKETAALQDTMTEVESKNNQKVAEVVEQKEALEVKIASLESKRSEELELATLKHIQALELANAEKTELQAKIEDLQAKHVEGLELAKSQSSELGKLAEVESKAELEKAQYNRKIREVRAEHSKEIEELITQLDLIEAEHNQRFNEKEKQVAEKDTVISALGSQLAEAQSRYAEMCESSVGLEADLDTLRNDIKEARAETESGKQDIVRLVAEHQKALEHEVVLREEACAQAREEMIQRAEVRYGEANKLFRNLKQKFDEANVKIADLEKSINLTTKQSEETKRRLEAQERELRDELAQSKATIATSDAKAAKLQRQFKADLQQALEKEEIARLELQKTKATSQQIQSTLAAVVAEKEKLTNEYNEMKSVCEELMAMVEGSAA